MVDNRSGSQDQSKVEKIQKGKVYHRKFQYEGPFQKIKEFEKIVKVPYLKRILKHEPTWSYFHLVVFLGECMMRYGENNHHVHNGYEETMDPSLDVNDTEEDESKNIYHAQTFSQTLIG